jgi:hypothetical protein
MLSATQDATLQTLVTVRHDELIIPRMTRCAGLEVKDDEMHRA